MKKYKKSGISFYYKVNKNNGRITYYIIEKSIPDRKNMSLNDVEAYYKKHIKNYDDPVDFFNLIDLNDYKGVMILEDEIVVIFEVVLERRNSFLEDFHNIFSNF